MTPAEKVTKTTRAYDIQELESPTEAEITELADLKVELGVVDDIAPHETSYGPPE